MLSFTGCEAGGEQCTTKGRPLGEIDTKALEGRVGWISKATKKVALALNPVVNGPFIEYGCGTRSVTISGGVLVPLKADKMLGAQALKYLGKKGVQKPERLEGGSSDTLSSLKKAGASNRSS